MVQWLRICLPTQGTWVWSLVGEDPTCRGAAKPVHHNYWACALEPASHNYWSLCTANTEPTTATTEARVLQLLKLACLEPVLHNKRSHRMRSPRTPTKSIPLSPQLEKACAQQQRPNTAKKIKNKITVPRLVWGIIGIICVKGLVLGKQYVSCFYHYAKASFLKQEKSRADLVEA